MIQKNNLLVTHLIKKNPFWIVFLCKSQDHNQNAEDAGVVWLPKSSVWEVYCIFPVHLPSLSLLCLHKQVSSWASEYIWVPEECPFPDNKSGSILEEHFSICCFPCLLFDAMTELFSLKFISFPPELSSKPQNVSLIKLDDPSRS